MGYSGSYMDLNQMTQYAKSAPTLPPGWMRFPIRRTTIADGLVALVFGILTGVLAIGFFLRGTIFTSSYYQPLVQGGSFELIWLLAILFNLFLCAALLTVSVPRLRRLGHLGDFFFLVTPEAFAQVSHTTVVGLPIADVVQVCTNWNKTVLIVTRRGGAIVRLRGMADYSRRGEIVGAIVSAMNRAAMSSNAGRPPHLPPSYVPPQQQYTNPYPGSPYQRR
ncbi:MAG TPA: hypothetical protein VKT82_33625 [Ktedonobacterales bacterium]|nr:hypothetical protein [Ktedonobacterales bacterium]